MIETSGHLPECPCTAVGMPSCICDDGEECGPQCRHHCICDRLRSAEARVRLHAHLVWEADEYEVQRTTYADGYAAGVRAARAIAWDAKCDCTRGTGEEHSPYCLTVSMLAAIDALSDMTPSDGGER